MEISHQIPAPTSIFLPLHILFMHSLSSLASLASPSAVASTSCLSLSLPWRSSSTATASALTSGAGPEGEEAGQEREARGATARGMPAERH